MRRTLARIASRALVLAAALATAGCYDLDALSRSYTTQGHDGGTSGGGGDGGAPATPDLAGGGGSDGGWRPIAAPSTAALRAVSGDGSTILAVGAASTVLRLSPGAAPAVESVAPGFELRAVTVGGSSAFAAGDSGAVLTRAAGSWSDAMIVDATFYAVTLLGSGEPLVVGSGGTVEQHTSNGWLAQDPGVTAHLRGAWTQPSGDVIVVGDGGTILHGAAGEPLGWSTVTSPVSGDLSAVWGNAADAWIVGAAGVILHAAGSGAWTSEASGTTADLFGVFGAGDVVWAVGAGGVIVARRGGAWTLEHSGGPALRAVWAGSNVAFAVGDGGTILRR